MLIGIIGSVCFILGSAIFFFVGIHYRKSIAEATIGSAEEQAEKIIQKKESPICRTDRSLLFYFIIS